MTYLAIKSSRWQNSLLLLASTGFVAGGIFLLLTGGPALVGWMSIVFFGAGMPIFGSRLMDSRPRLVINDEGISDRTLGVGLIPWSQIEGAYVRSISGNDFICLNVTNSDEYLRKFNVVRRAMITVNEELGFTQISVNLSGLGVDTNQIFELILKKCAVNGMLKDGQ